MRTMLVILLAWVVVVSAIVIHKEPSKTRLPRGWAQSSVDKLKEDAQSAAEKTSDTVKDLVQTGKEKATEVATNVADGFKTGVQKAEDAATNVAAKAKEVTTNVVGEVKSKIDGLKH